MSDLTRYRIDWNKWKNMRSIYIDVGPDQMIEYGVLVPDSTLQDIAEAWNEWFDIDEGPTVLKSLMRSEWMDFAALLDALKGTDK